MEFGEKDIKNMLIAFIILLLAVIAFFIIRPILNAIFGGLILAYIFHPLYSKLRAKTGYPSISALFVCIVILLIILIPIFFIIPNLIEQSFSIFSASQSINFQSAIMELFPGATTETIAKTSIAVNSFAGKAGTLVLASMSNLFLDLPDIALQFLVIAFVFFFSLRDGNKLKEFAAGLSPLSKTKEGLFVRQFKDITDSVLYGIVIVGIFQGITAGLGFWIFGIPNAMFLTILAMICSLIPLVGPSVVWIPVTVYLFIYSTPAIAIAYLIYNLIIVSTIDNILRSYIVSRKSNISTAIIIIGIVGGVVVFGVMGIIMGPLVLAYLVTLLRAYKEKRIYSLFYEE